MASQTDWRGLFGPAQQPGGLFAPRPHPAASQPPSPGAGEGMGGLFAPRPRPMDGLPSMRPDNPTLRERMGNVVYDFFMARGLPSTADQYRDVAIVGADVMPGLGVAVGSEEVGRAYDAGDYLGAALDGGGLLLGMAVPGGGAAGRGLRKAAKTAKQTTKSGRRQPDVADDADEPINEAERAAYLAEFREPVSYHGTDTSFSGFDPSRSGEATGAATARMGVWSAFDPKIADLYADTMAHRRGGNAQIYPLRFRSRKQGRVHLQGDELESEIAATIAQAWDDGFDSVVFENFTSPEGTKHAILIVKDAAQLRSPWAKFDPKKRASADLLAGLAGGGAVVFGAVAQDGKE